MHIHAHVPRWFEVVLVLAVLLAALFARGSMAGASPPSLAGAPAVTTSSSPSTTPAETLPPDVQAQLDALSPGTVIVPCNSSEARYPEGITPAIGAMILHPGWRLLAHGYCADNPTATPLPVPMLDPQPSETAAP
jgi:hypothetical protein